MAIDLITEHIRMKLQQHDLRRIYPNLEVGRSLLSPLQQPRSSSLGVLLSQHCCRRLPGTRRPPPSLSLFLLSKLLPVHVDCPCPDALQVIPTNYQIRGMHTIIRDRTTHHADFVFYADRLLRLVRRRCACQQRHACRTRQRWQRRRLPRMAAWQVRKPPTRSRFMLAALPAAVTLPPPAPPALRPAGGGGGAGPPALCREDGDDAHGAPVCWGGLCQEAVRREHHPQRGEHGECAAGLLQGDQDWEDPGAQVRERGASAGRAGGRSAWSKPGTAD